MKTLREVLEEAERSRVAVGHFNISDLIMLKAVVESAQELNAPVLVGVSEGERDFMGVRQVAALVRSIRDEYGLPIFLNADHTHSLEKAVEAAVAGFDALVFDSSSKPFDENVSGLAPDFQLFRSGPFMTGGFASASSQRGSQTTQ